MMAIFACLPMFLTAQQNASAESSTLIDARLYDAYGKTYVDRVALEDDFLINRWTFYLDHAYFISDSPLAKDGAAAESYPSVNVTDLAKINILKLEKEQDLKRAYHTETIYKIAGTEKYLVYYAGRDFIERFNHYWDAKRGK